MENLPTLTRSPKEREAAFEQEVRRLQGLVYTIIFGIVLNVEETWDLVQETFMKAHAETRFLDEPFERKAWIARVARNLALNARRSIIRQVQRLLGVFSTSVNAEFPGPEETAIEKEIREELRRELTRLPLNERELLTLRYGAELSYREIASVMEIPIGTVMSRLARLKEKLELSLDEESPS